MKDVDYAFPGRPGFFQEGMTLRQYAAIKLRVPRSGDPEIDAMIRESRRADFAEAAMEARLAGILASGSWDSREIRIGPTAKEAFAYADAMIAEWDKAKTEEKVSDDA
jgi:hypothetical protein